MPVDKSKLMSLVKAQSPMPSMGGKLKGLKPAPVIGKPGAKPPMAAPPKQSNSPSAAIDDMDIPQMVEDAAAAAEAGGDIELEDVLADYDLTQMDVAPGWATDKEAWEKAKTAVGLGEPEAEDRYEEPFAVAAYLYKMLGGKMGGWSQEPDEPTESLEEEQSESPAEEAAEGPAHEAAESPEHEAAEHPEKAGGSPMDALLEDAAAEAESNPDPALMDMLEGYDPASGAPPAGVDAKKWATAVQAVDPDGAGVQYPDPWAVVAHVYKRIGGKVGAPAPAPAAAPAMPPPGGAPPAGL